MAVSRRVGMLARYGLPSTEAVRADLAAAGLLTGTGDADRDNGASASARPPVGSALDTPTDARVQSVLVALARAGRPELAVQHLAGIVTALREAPSDRAASPGSDNDGDSGAGTDAERDSDSVPDRAVSGASNSRDAHGSDSDPAGEFLTALQTDPGFRGRLIGLLGASETLGEHVVAYPHTWRTLADQAAFAERTSPQMCAAALQAAVRDNDGELLPASVAITPLRAAYRTRLAVIAGADVASAVEPGPVGPDLDDVCRALTILADGLLTVALQLAEAEYPTSTPFRFAVITMGKSGANELNYVSDVDAIFVADAAAPDATATDIAAPDTDRSTSDAAMLQTATLRATELMRICERVAWEVDANLRPEGTAGPLVRTLAGYTAYYQRWAKTWEFQALLKARAAVGDTDLGEAFLDMAGRNVWTAADRDSFVADVQAMRRRVRDTIPPADRDRDLKLGSGGLRDVEFAVQLLQLVHGRSDESLRVPGTLAALGALTAGGYVGRTDAAKLADAYVFQRRIEHLLQLQHLLRTHSLPVAVEDQLWLARTDGFAAVGPGTSDPAKRLVAELSRRVSTVRRLHEKLFYRPLLTAVAAVPTDELRLTEKAATNRLAALGFAAPQPALRHIAALTDGVSRRAAIQRTLLPVLLGTFSEAPDPDSGLLGYRRVSDALASTPWYLRLLRDEGLVAQRLAGLLGTSTLVADLLQRAPEVLRLLVHDDDLAGPDPNMPAVAAASALLARAGRARTAPGAASAARSARRHEMLRLACADLLGLIDTSTVTSGLTIVADAAVQAVLQAAHREVAADRRGEQDDSGTGDAGELVARVAVMAVGRFGGGEMSYASDADVLFVAGPAHPDVDSQQMMTDATAIAKLTTRLLATPSPDPPLRIDADLRPEGRGGPLVRTVESYQRYWQRNVEPWQRQALLRARPISGDDDLTSSFVEAVDPIRYPPDGLDPSDVREIRRIKARVDAERLPRGADRTLHTKLGRGGLADVEWTVQLLQLQHAGAVPELRHTDTISVIRAATEAHLMSQNDADALVEGWTMATRARNAIMLVTGKPGDEIPAHGRVLAGVARACGYSVDADSGEFIDDYRRATRHARRVVDELFDRG